LYLSLFIEESLQRAFYDLSVRRGCSPLCTDAPKRGIRGNYAMRGVYDMIVPPQRFTLSLQKTLEILVVGRSA